MKNNVEKKTFEKKMLKKNVEKKCWKKKFPLNLDLAAGLLFADAPLNLELAAGLFAANTPHCNCLKNVEKKTFLKKKRLKKICSKK